MHKFISRIAAGGAALLAIPVLGLATAQVSHAEAKGSNETVTKGAYKAVFHHTGSKGETLAVSDNATDGDAAVAYVQFYAPGPNGRPPRLVDSDRLIVTNGYRSFNLREYDHGSYDVPEGHGVRIMICRGYKSIPGDNCSPWGWGTAEPRPRRPDHSGPGGRCAHRPQGH